MSKVTDSIVNKVFALLQRTRDDQRPVVVMTCGIAGAGKTTLSKAIVQRLAGFTRLSNDEIIFQRHGVYGVDYPADSALYDEYQDEADELFIESFVRLLEEGNDVILDRSFYSREDRDKFLEIINHLGGRRVLVFLKADKELLWRRISERSEQEKGANNALRISRELFESYWDGFESPSGEGEVVIFVE